MTMKQSPKYNLVFHGELVVGCETEDVRHNLATRFHQTEAKLDQLFVKTPFIVKHAVDYKTALKYQIVFEWAGAVCHIEPIDEAQEDPAFEQYQRCNVIFDGTLVQHHSVDEVKQNLMTCLKLPERRVNELFDGHPVIIMEDVDYHPALKIQTSFELAGAVCRIEVLSVNDPADPLSSVKESPLPEDRTYATMSCPKCGLEQKKARRCRQCGVYVENYLKRSDISPSERRQHLAEKRQAAMKRDLSNWGIGLVVLGVIQIAGLGLWATGILLLGVVNFFLRRRQVFLLNGITVIASGALNLIFILIQYFVTHESLIKLNFGGENVEPILVFGLGILFSGIQMYFGFQAFKQFTTYAPRKPKKRAVHSAARTS